jgi:hypothetical protein
MSLVTAQLLLESEIKALTPGYLAHPFVEAPRSRPIEDLPASNEQRQFTVRLDQVTGIEDFDGESHELACAVDIKIRYRLLGGADEADRDLYLMAAVDAHQITRYMIRPDVPASWAGTIQNARFSQDLGNIAVANDPSSIIRHLRFELVTFE